jgi:hypothetical protein
MPSRVRSRNLSVRNSGKLLTFALGPRLLDGEEAPDKEEEDSDQADEAEGQMVVSKGQKT